MRALPWLSLPLRRYFSSERNVLGLRRGKLFEDIFPNEARNEVSALLSSGQQCVYAGFDPTSDSLHVGNLLILINLLHWQRAGHDTIALVGGATGLIGDPSGRSTERPELAYQKVEANAAGIRENIETIFKNHHDFIWQKKQLPPVRVVNNLSWYKELDLLHFFSRIGRHFRVGQMLSRHSVKSRLASEQGISFTEFSYQIFQSYDWLHLLKNYNCRFQVGGNDQMGNIVSGHDLIGQAEKKNVYGLTLPLIVSESGSKFGKSAGNAVWLNADKTPPFELYQFFVRTPDLNTENLLRLFTFLPDEEIDNLRKSLLEEPHKRAAQEALAEQVTLLVHGESGLRTAQLASDALYKGDLAALEQLPLESINRLFSGASVCTLDPNKTRTIMEFALETKCYRDEIDAKPRISAGGFYVNMRRMNDPNQVFHPADFILKNKITLVRTGKRNYHIINWTS
ncbi:tyrosine--tRNA ligase, mitochondrial [Neocloeon triangulifer]|uniref:tyrosine--tRNA ligase, mitochondrial n=1 Tax=Neocloeon triangulifer TaxID=2078957 RepID=UPI00286EE6D2|nr:tyrosine--tRNA ligase, mitochondrial [Neocloeon triangulifer]XP_059472109.1 tyrosine--tRNA ligase, mitochondrial [Neocloeon triangulifer]